MSMNPIALEGLIYFSGVFRIICFLIALVILFLVVLGFIMRFLPDKKIKHKKRGKQK